MVATTALLLVARLASATAVEIINHSGDGLGRLLDQPDAITADADGNAYVAGSRGRNVFKITPEGSISQIFGSANYEIGAGWLPDLLTDGDGNVYLAHLYENRVVKIAPGGSATSIIDAAGDGTHALSGPRALAMDGEGNVYVSAYYSSNVFKITPAGEITQILDASGDGVNAFGIGAGIAVDGAGNVYANGQGTNNTFRIPPDGEPVQIFPVDSGPSLLGASGLALDGLGNLYVGGQGSHNVLKIPLAAPTLATEVFVSGADTLVAELAASPTGIIYAAVNDASGLWHGRVFEIRPDAAIAEIDLPDGLDSDGDGPVDPDRVGALTVDANGDLYVTGGPLSNNAFKITLAPPAACACDANRLEAWAAYVTCVEAAVGKFYADGDDSYGEDLKVCRGTYFDTWAPGCGARFTDNGDGTVTDHLTDLVWEKKTTAVGSGVDFADPHDVDNPYTWSSPNAALPAIENGTAFTDFLAQLNAGAGFAKANGWRLPTLAELQTLMDSSGTGMLPAFPDRARKLDGTPWSGPYWTSTASLRDAHGCHAATEVAWNVTFDPGERVLPATGGVNVDGKRDNRFVRAVRGGL